MEKLKKFLCFLCLACLCAGVYAAPAVQNAQGSLNSVEKALDEAGKNLRDKQAVQAKIAAQIREVDKKLAAQQRELKKIDREKKQAVAELTALQNNILQLQTQIEGIQAQMAQLLDAHYRNRQPDVLILLMQNADPNEKGRRLHYMRYFQSANRQVAEDLMFRQRELALQGEEVERRLAQITELLKRRQEVVRSLTREKRNRAADLAKVNREIDGYAGRMKTLRSDKQRLTALLQKISREKAQKAAAGRKAAQQKAQTARKVPIPEPNVIYETAGENGTSAGKSEVSAEKSAAPAAGTAAFSRLRGQLHLPLSGSVDGRFGTARTGGGAWNGIFIRAEPQDVAAIAAGTVGYAGDVRGYGNTVIIDHGGNYFSIYTGLSAVSTAKGAQVAARQSIGRSGTLPEGMQGLYLEIRYQDRALNPMAWFR